MTKLRKLGLATVHLRVCCLQLLLVSDSTVSPINWSWLHKAYQPITEVSNHMEPK